MHALIVFAHPDPRSYNGAMKDVALYTLANLGWTVEVSDLYAEGFNPAAGPDDVRAPQHPDRSFSLMRAQRLASTTGGYTEQIEREQLRLARADLVIFQFPVWWYSVPAILKGWFDRVLTNGFAYDDDNLFDDGFLRGKRALISMTTGGNEEELAADADRTGTPQDWLRAVQGGTLGFVGMQVLPAFISFAPNSMDEDGRHAELRRWGNHLVCEIEADESLDKAPNKLLA